MSYEQSDQQNLKQQTPPSSSYSCTKYNKKAALVFGSLIILGSIYLISLYIPIVVLGSRSQIVSMVGVRPILLYNKKAALVFGSLIILGSIYLISLYIPIVVLGSRSQIVSMVGVFFAAGINGVVSSRWPRKYTIGAYMVLSAVTALACLGHGIYESHLAVISTTARTADKFCGNGTALLQPGNEYESCQKQNTIMALHASEAAGCFFVMVVASLATIYAVRGMHGGVSPPEKKTTTMS